jgi:crossover junction endodeoxyribonuclease RuvC
MGVDPGLHITGYGVIDSTQGRCRLVEGGVIRPGDDTPLEHRLRLIHDGLGEVIAEHSPEVIVVEDIYSKYSFPRTAILIGHARGVVYLTAGERSIPIHAYPASLVKRAVAGNGRATKAQVSAMICQLLALAAPPHPVDVTDALALAVCHTSALRTQLTERSALPEALQAVMGARGGRRR